MVDADLADEFERGPEEELLPQINTAIRELLERRRQQRALKALVEDLEKEHGPLGPEDEPEIQRYMRILQGLPTS